MKQSRRKSLKKIGMGLAALPILSGSGLLLNSCSGNSKEKLTDGAKKLFFEISLAQWSLNHSFFGRSRQLSFGEIFNRLQTDPDSLLQGTLDPKNFPSIARNTFGLDAIEYVNTFFFGHAEDSEYLNALRQRCNDEGVRSLLIMCDAEGNLGDLNEEQRIKAVENHYKWVDAASFLGCHSIRVNAAGNGTAEEVKSAAVDGLGRLTEYGAKNNINVIVENHGGYSSDGRWLSDVISQVNNDRCGTLPDFGNFCISNGANGCEDEYDRYTGVKELMPFAKGVSAKAHDFDAEGNETHTNYVKMLGIVKEAGYTGHIGIEYEGSTLSEEEGIKKTIALLKKAGANLA